MKSEATITRLEVPLSLDPSRVSTRFGRRFAAGCLVVLTFVSTHAPLLYAQEPPSIRSSAARLAVAEARNASATADDPSPQPRRRASLAEKIAWGYLLVGGCIFIVTSPGEKNADGTWSTDGKAEMAAGIGALGLSFAMLRDVVGK